MSISYGNFEDRLRILKHLQENLIADKTEDAVYARISNEVGIKLRQVREIMREMLDERLVSFGAETLRGYKVRFELTEVGKERLRDPKEWQKRIEEEKEKWRSIAENERKKTELARVRQAGARAMQDFVAVEKRWQNVGIPSKQEIEDIKNSANYLRTKISQLNDRQPKCWLLKESYDSQFSAFKAQVEETMERNRRTLTLFDDFSFVEERSKDVHMDIESLKKWQETNKKLMDSEQMSHALNILVRLDMLKRCFEQFNKRELEEIEQLRGEFEKNSPILERLAESTHEWEPIKKQTVITKPERIARPEGSLGSRPAEYSAFVVKRRCKRCLKEQ